LIQVFSR